MRLFGDKINDQEKWHPYLVALLKHSGSRHSREDRISLSTSDMQETRQTGCMRQYKHWRVGARK